MSELTIKTVKLLTGHGSDVACVVLIVAATKAHIVYFIMVPTQTPAEGKYVLIGGGRFCQ